MPGFDRHHPLGFLVIVSATVIYSGVQSSRSSFRTAPESIAGEFSKATQTYDTLVRNVGKPRHAGIATLVPTLTIGGADATADEYIFASVSDILAATDGSLWMIDGRTGGKAYAVRRFSESGAFIRNIGRSGDGPGEWRSPSSLAQLRDGRVILRDAVVGKPLTFFKQNGDFDTTWAFKTSTIWSLSVDSSNAIWMRLQAGVSFHSTSSFANLRLNTKGAIIDTVPELARLPVKATPWFTPNSGRGSVSVPYQPSSLAAWSPHGHYARAVSSRYAIDLLFPRKLPSGRVQHWRNGDRVVSIRSNTRTVAISDAERDEHTARMRAKADALGAESQRLPSVPKSKPVLRSLKFDPDGRLWVGISQPSERFEPEQPETSGGRPSLPAIKWREPLVYDVFDPDGHYIGRVAAPRDLQLALGTLIQARGDVVWGVARDTDGVDAIRRYRIAWGSGR